MLLALRNSIYGLADISAMSVAGAAGDPACCKPLGKHAKLSSCQGLPCPLRGWTIEQEAETCTWAGVECNDKGQVISMCAGGSQGFDDAAAWGAACCCCSCCALRCHSFHCAFSGALPPPASTASQCHCPCRDFLLRQAVSPEPRDQLDDLFPTPPVRVTAAFMELLGQLPALQKLAAIYHTLVFDAPTPLPASWARLAHLREVNIHAAAFTGGLPEAWAAAGALPSLTEL